MQRKHPLRRSVGLLSWLAVIASCANPAGKAPGESLGRNSQAVECIENSSAAGSPPWVIGTAYSFGALVTFQGVVYACITDHTASANDAPASRPDLWTVPDYCTESAWQAGTTYAQGAIVEYNGERYVATQSNTGSPPGAGGVWAPQMDLACPSSGGAAFAPDLTSSSTSGVGGVPASFLVSLDGRAQYSIPIEVPPGRGGIQPALSVVYDSTAGQGLLGTGFNLVGLSEVARCGSNMSDDHVLRPVAYDAGDHYCLDGLRLTPVNGSGGATSTEYRTEPDTFRKIVASRDCSSCTPLSFRVYNKDGTIADYGTETSGKIMATGGVVASWELSEVSDRNGNFMTVAYENDLNTPDRDNLGPYTYRFAPLRIDYAGHQPAGASAPDVQPAKSLVFRYGEPRTFATDHYSHGLHLEYPDLLTTIEVNGPGTHARTYEFTYQTQTSSGLSPTQTGRDRLVSVDALGVDGTSVGATTFAYHVNEAQYVGLVDIPTQLKPAQQNVFTTFNTMLDVNGDGLDDVVTISEQLSGNPDVNHQIQNTLTIALQPSVYLGTGLLGATYSATTISWDNRGVIALYPADVDQDGLTDLLALEVNSAIGGSPPSVLQWLRSTGSGFEAPKDTAMTVPQNAPALADYDGDGLLDFVICGNGSDQKTWLAYAGKSQYKTSTAVGPLHGFPCNLQQATNATNPSEAWYYESLASQVSGVDLDGDGAQEILAINGFAVNSPAEFVRWNAASSTFSLAGGMGLVAGDLGRFVDVNGDGLQDMVAIRPLVGNEDYDSQLPLSVWINSGNGLLKPAAAGATTLSTNEYDSAVFADFDDDGKVDILTQRKADLSWHIFRFGYVTPFGAPSNLCGTGGNPPVTICTLVPGFTESQAVASTGLARRGSAAVYRGWHNPASVVFYDVTKSALSTLENASDPFSDTVALITPATGQPAIAIDTSPLLDALSSLNLGKATLPDGSPDLNAWLSAGYAIPKGCAYPLSCVLNWRPIVWHYAIDDGHLSGSDVFLQFTNGRYDRLGRGWLGFEEVERQTYFNPTGATFGSFANLDESWVFDNSHFDGPERSTRAGLATDYVLHSGSTCEPSTQTHVDYQRYARPAANGGETFFYAPSSRTERQMPEAGFSCKPAAPGAATTYSTTTTFTMRMDGSGVADAAGNIASSVTTTDGIGRQEQTSFEYGQEDTTNWLIGLPTHITVTSLEPGAPAGPTSQVREERAVYDGNGQVQDITLAPGNPSRQLQITRHHDAFGNVILVSTTGNEGSSTITRQRCYTFDDPEATYPTVTGNDLGQLTYQKFDPNFGSVTQQLEAPNGLVTRWAYDGLGRRTIEARADGSASSTLFGIQDDTVAGAFVLSAATTDTSGAFVDDRFDHRGRLVARRSPMVSPSGATPRFATEEWTYDPRDSLVEHTWPNDGTTPSVVDQLTYDAFGRFTKQTRSVSGGAPTGLTAASYSGRQTTMADGKGQTTSTQRDAAGRVVSSKDASGGVTTFAYGPFDRIIGVTDPVGQSSAGHSRAWAYDDYGVLLSTDDPDRGHRDYLYSAFGPLLVASGPGTTKRYSYDLLERPLQLADEDGVTQWTWDQGPHAAGRLVAVVGPDTTTARAYAYDAAGRVSTESTQVGGDTASIGYAYDDSQGHGRLDTVTYPGLGGAFAVKLAYDPWGHLIQESNLATGATLWSWISGDASNRVTQDAFGGGTATRSRTFDQAQDGALTAIQTSAGGAPLQNLSYKYDANRNLTSRQDLGGWTWQGTTGSAHTESFCYDALDRLTNVDLDQPPCTGATTQLGYDPDGNITAKSDVGAYGYDPVHVHAVSTAGSGAFTYDGRGNQLTRPRDPSDPPGLTGTPTLLYTALDLPRAVLTGNVSSQIIPVSPPPPPVCGGVSPPRPPPNGPLACLTGTQLVDIQAGATVKTDVAAGALLMGVGASLAGNATVAGGATVEASASLSGTLTLGGQLLELGGANIGKVVASSNVSVNAPPAQSVAAGSSLLNVAPFFPQTIAPGNYGAAIIDPGASATFTAGSYNFESLFIGSGASVTFDTSGGPIALNVDGAVVMLGPITFSGGDPVKTQLYTNACAITMAGGVTFPGSINAPNADITVGLGGAAAGCIWARAVHVAVGGQGTVGTGSAAIDCEVGSSASQSTLVCSDNATRYTYDAEGTRVLKVTPTSRTLYAGGLYERVTDTASGTTTHKYYVQSPAGPVAVVTRVLDLSGNPVGADAVSYLLTDHLGSLDVAVNDAGQTSERRSYDAFGKRRALPGTTLSSSGQLDPLLQGFTGQEDDVNLGLVNMRGRIYDPRIGRFLSTDPFVATPFWSQSWNRYSYTDNNPLSLIDPSGFQSLPPGTTAPGTYEDSPFTIIIGGSEDEDAVTIIYHRDSSAVPVEFAGGVPPAPGWWWPNLSHVDATELTRSFRGAVTRELDKTVQAAEFATVARISPASAIVLSEIGVFDPTPANAPRLGEPTYNRPSELAFQANIIVPALLPAAFGQLGKVLGPGEEIPFAPESPAPIEVASRTEALELSESGGFSCPCFTAATAVATSLGDVAIGDLELGERVLPDDAACHGASFEGFVRVDLRSGGHDGRPGTLSLLRPESWARALDARVGRSVYVTLDDVGVSGWAEVTALSPAPAVADGAGCVVTGIFRHTADDLVAVRLGDGSVIDATGGHLLFSESRQDWTPVRELQVGELLRTGRGVVQVVALEPEQASQGVFNVEIAFKHQYLVGAAHVLAHNACTCVSSAAEGLEAAGAAAKFTASTPQSAIALAKQLASEAQLGEMAAGAGRPIAGPGTATVFRDAARIAQTYGGNAADWAKMSSSGFRAADGTTFATHWVENVVTGAQAEPKVVIDIFGGP